MSDGNTWQSVDLYGPDVRVERDSATGRFRVTVAGARRARGDDGDAPVLEFGPENATALEALLLALADAKRDLTGDDFVPGKSLRPTRAPDPGEVTVRLEPEDVEYLRARVRVGKEDSLDDALGKAVKVYMRDLLRRGFGDEDDAEAAPAEPPHARATRATRNPRQSTLGKPTGLTGVGTTQLRLLQVARQKGFITRLDVGRAYGISPRRGGAASARARTDGHLNALVARRLIVFKPRPSGEPAWELTETGRVALEEMNG